MLLALLLCYTGFTALCLSLDRHHADLLGRKPSALRRLVLRLGGGLLLALSLWAAVATFGWGRGLVEWCAVLMISALLLVWLVAYRPRWALAMAALGLLASPVAAFASL